MKAAAGHITPTVEGLMLCLRFLAEEATTLNLEQTHGAIARAMRTAARESATLHAPVPVPQCHQPVRAAAARH